MRNRDYDPRTNRGNRGLVSSIAAGWRDEQKKMPRMSTTSQKIKTYSGAPLHDGPLSASMIMDRSDPGVTFAGSTRDMNMSLSRNMRLQNISSHRRVSEPEETTAAVTAPTGPKRPSFPKGVAKAMRRSVRHIFVNKSEFAAADIADFSDSETNIEYPEQDHSRRTSISISDFDSPLHDSHNLNDTSVVYDSNIFEGTGRIPVLTAKKKDTTSKRGRSKKNKGEDKEEEGYDADHASRIRSRSESILGRMRRRSDEQRKRRGRGGRGSVSPKRTSMPASPIPQRKRVGFLRGSTATAISTSDIARAALENMNRNSNGSPLGGAKLTSDVFHVSKEKDRTLSTHSSRGMGSDFFSDPEGVDGSIRESSRRPRVPWGTDLDASSRHSRTVAEVLMDYSNSGMSSFRSQIPLVPDNSVSHGLTMARLNSSMGEQPEQDMIASDTSLRMDISNNSLPHLSPFSSVANSSYQGGTPYFAGASPYESDSDQMELSKRGSDHRRDAEMELSKRGSDHRRDAELELSKRGSDHRRRQNKKGRQLDNLQASDSQFNQASEAKASSNTRASRIAKDPTEVLRATQQPSQRMARRARQREISKMSSSDRTHEVRRTRLSIEEPKSNRRRSLEQDTSLERAVTYGSLMEKQTKPKGSRGSSRRKASMDTSESQMKQRRQSKSVRGRSKSNRNSSEEPGLERRKASGRKGRRQSSNSKSKTRSSSEGERKRSQSKKPKSSKALKHKLEEKMASDNEEDEESVEWSRVASPAPDTLAQTQMIETNTDEDNAEKIPTSALNRSNYVNDALPSLEGSGLDRMKLTHAGADSVADGIVPGPRSYHPRTQPLIEGTSDKPVSKSYHGGSEARSKAKKDSSKDRRDSGKKKKKKKSLEAKDLNGVDLTSLGPDQIRALLQRNTINSRAQERERSGETRRKSRGSSMRPKREGSERVKSRGTKKTEEERRSRSRSNSKQNKATKDMDKSDHEGSARKKKQAKEYGEDEIRRSFTEAWCEFGEEAGFG